MADLFHHVHHLSKVIGPRGSATPKEAEAADYIEEELKEMGFSPIRETFRSVTSFSWPFMLIYASFPIAVALFFIRPLFGALLTVLGFILFFLESTTFPVLSSRMPKKTSQNIRAVVEARSKAVRRVVISAHYDSSRSALNFAPNMVSGFRRSYLAMLFAMEAIVLLLILGTFLPFIKLYVGIIAILPALFLLGTIIFLIHRETQGEYTPGANDNASGVAVLLEIARILGKNRLISTSVELLATGCEEAGTVGMIHYIKTHLVDKNTLFINLDNLGAGKVSVTTREGMILSKNASPDLLEIAHETVDEKCLAVDFRPYQLLTTDATAVMVRGYGAFSVMGIDENGLLPNWHWHTDVAENVNPENLETAKALVLGMLRKIDQ
ncbi:MAG TPA: M20/M25/M40 family metallo-hydrolase [Bacillota bacterium]|nr:M20/M25/M40 family metallo-hydrolase [Bacillota bacterium]